MINASRLSCAADKNGSVLQNPFYCLIQEQGTQHFLLFQRQKRKCAGIKRQQQDTVTGLLKGNAGKEETFPQLRFLQDMAVQQIHSQLIGNDASVPLQDILHVAHPVLKEGYHGINGGQLILRIGGLPAGRYKLGMQLAYGTVNIAGYQLGKQQDRRKQGKDDKSDRSKQRCGFLVQGFSRDDGNIFPV